jgi:hypothetical protein
MQIKAMRRLRRQAAMLVLLDDPLTPGSIRRNSEPDEFRDRVRAPPE